MNAKSAALLAAGLVVAAGVVSFAPSWTLQGKMEKRLEQAEQQQAQNARQLEQLDKTLNQLQEKLLPLKDVPPSKWRLVHERKHDPKGTATTTFIIGWIMLDEIATGDLHVYEEGSGGVLRKVSDKSKK